MLGRVLLVSAVLLGAASITRAQQIEPRTYSNAPIGINFLLAGYGYIDGTVVVDPSVQLENAQLQVHTTLIACVRTLNLWGLPAKVDGSLPYAWLSGTADFAGQPVQREVDGFGDFGVRLSAILIGAPALSLPEFASYRQNTLVGASVRVSLPTGQYDSGKVVNIGTNRWFVRPEVGGSQALGRWTLELATAATFFGDNADFLGGQTREQAPVYSVQGGVIYNFPRGIWAALNGTYYVGGRTTVDGVDGNDRQENTRSGLTVTVPAGHKHSIKLYASTGVSTRTGGNYDMVSAIWQYRWGGGL